MEYCVWRCIYFLAFGVLFTKEVASQCAFPESWSDKTWMLRRNDPNDVTFGLITYNVTNAHTSVSNTQDQTKDFYSCDSFENTDNHYYYIRSNQVVDTKTCVVDSFVNDIILHREINTTESLSSLANCKTALNNVPLYSVYAPITVQSDGQFQVEPVVNCPFRNIPYQVSYTLINNADDICKDNASSVLTVSQSTISILACKYKLFPRVPLSGTIKCNALITPSDLGEPNDDNGGAVIIKWQTRTTKEAFVYCARYKMIGNNAKLSIDITSTSEVSCLRNANYDWFQDHDDRNYVRLNLNYRDSLVSGPPIITTPRFTTSPPSSFSTSPGPTRAPGEDITYVQFKVDLRFTQTPNDRETFTNYIQDDIIGALGTLVSKDDFTGDMNFTSSTEGLLVITMHLKNPTDAQLDGLLGLVDTNEFVVRRPEGSPVDVLKDTFYNWRDDDKCLEKQCANNGTCWVLQGEYTCQCPDPFTVPFCIVSAITSPNTGVSPTIRLIIIIVCCLVGLAILITVIVFIVLRQKKSKKKKVPTATLR